MAFGRAARNEVAAAVPRVAAARVPLGAVRGAVALVEVPGVAASWAAHECAWRVRVHFDPSRWPC